MTERVRIIFNKNIHILVLCDSADTILCGDEETILTDIFSFEEKHEFNRYFH